MFYDVIRGLKIDYWEEEKYELIKYYSSNNNSISTVREEFRQHRTKNKYIFVRRPTK